MAVRLGAIGQDRSSRTLVAEVGGAVVGVAGVWLSRYYERNGLYGRLVLLAVDDNWRRQGIGRTLVTEAEAWAVARGANSMVVNSGQHRHEAHRFYERTGYAATGLRFVKRL